jgi:thioredoxin reductase (NADPH)
MKEHVYDLIIIGGGPGGISAAIYAARANLDILVLEKTYAGGQIASTDKMENYLGFKSISGLEFGERLEEHLQSAGVEITFEEVTEMHLKGVLKKIVTTEHTYLSRTIILAMGAQPRRLGVPGETELRGRGVSYCATCDGAFFKGQDVVVVGGGDTACDEALYLAGVCNKVYLVHRRDKLRARGLIAEKVKNHPKIEIIWDSTVEEITAENVVTGVNVKNRITGDMRHVDASGLFIAVGIVPQTALIKDQFDISEGTSIDTDLCMRTAIQGVFAVGDIRSTPLRQVITAAADGALAVYGVQEYLIENEFIDE